MTLQKAAALAMLSVSLTDIGEMLVRFSESEVVVAGESLRLAKTLSSGTTTRIGTT